MKKIKYLVALLGLVFSVGLTIMPAGAAAPDVLNNVCTGDTNSTVLCQGRNTKKNSFNNVVGEIVNTLLFIVAAVSVVVIIIAGITYTTSSGDAALVKRAKDSLLYAVVGLIVAIMAYAIVNYVINAFGA
jgi:hypothetical protein